jgi:peptide/nickel transport system substrate-binding protein
MASEYWNKWWGLRSNRRRFLQAGAATGIGAAGIALVGCGDDDDDDDDDDATNTPSGIQPTATTAPDATATPASSVTRGGILNLELTGDPPSIDPYGSPNFQAKGIGAFAYSRLYKLDTGPGIPPSEALPTPDIAESAEMIDATTWTVTLRQGVTFHDKPPVSGRALTTDDIQFSWDRATDEANANAGRLNSAIDSIEFPDAQTIRFNLTEPNAEFLDLLADTNLLQIQPGEADGGFNPAEEMIGSGPWIFDHYNLGSEIVWAANLDHYMAADGFPIVDGLHHSIIPEYASRLAQFRAGNTHISGINANDLVDVQSGLEGVQFSGIVAQLMSFFYWSDWSGDSTLPWANADVRKAISLAINRDEIMDLGYNVQELQDSGINVSSNWNNLIPAGMTRWWLDPQSAAQGDSAALFEFNPDEAAAMLQAAGFDSSNPLTFPYQYPGAIYGSTFDSIAQAHALFFEDIGIQPEVDVQDYTSQYFPQTFAGNFTGLAFGYETPFPAGGAYPQRFFLENSLNHSRVNDTEMADLARAQQREVDAEARLELFAEIQRKNAEKGYYFPSQAGAGTGWAAYQPNVRFNDIRTTGYGTGIEELPYYWIDTSA